jgi:(1->4)-alpha-D-glucan 1-alpha-D-glucosylmutase
VPARRTVTTSSTSPSINPELGGEEGFRALVAELRKHQLGMIVDFVPNHMAAGSDNPWWMDVLENGPASRYATMFDIDWDAPDPTTRGKVFLPVLGTSPEAAIAAGEITLQWDQALQKFVFCYYEHRLPVRKEDYPVLMGATGEGRFGPSCVLERTERARRTHRAAALPS